MTEEDTIQWHIIIANRDFNLSLYSKGLFYPQEDSLVGGNDIGSDRK